MIFFLFYLLYQLNYNNNLSDRITSIERKKNLPIEIKIKKMHDNAILPTLGTINSACFDLFAIEEVEILPNKTVVIPHGFAIEIKNRNDLHFAIYSRSGISIRLGLSVQYVGIIDNDYRGEMKSIIHNFSDQIQYITPGERITQIGLQRFITDVNFEVVNNLNPTTRGTGGFGSTGK